MRNKILCGFFFVSMSAFSLTQPKEVNAPVAHMFVPYGFDSNDNVEIILQGKFSDTCFQVGRTNHRVDHVKKEIRVWATAYDYSGNGSVCREVLTPFLQKISVGLLEKGDYKIKLVTTDASKEVNMKVEEARTTLPDAHLYAPVTGVQLSSDNSGQQTVTVSGQYPYMLTGCMSIKEVRSYRNPADVLVVLPIAEILDEADCPVNKNNEFRASTVVGAAIKGEGLLHVRVSNGNSLNHFVEIR